MITKDHIMKKVDEELKAFQSSVSPLKKDEDFITKLEDFANFRNILNDTSLSDKVIKLLSTMENILSNVYSYRDETDFERFGLEKDNFNEVFEHWIEQIEYPDPQARLLSRAEKEYENFIQGMREKSPDIIISSAYEISIKEDIMSQIECRAFSKKDIDILLTIKNPIDSIFLEWLSNDASTMDLIEDTIKDVIRDKMSQITNTNLAETDKASTRSLDEYTEEYELYDDDEHEV